MSGLRLPPGLVDLVLARTGSSSRRTTAPAGALWQAAARKQAHTAVALRPRILSPSYEEDSHSLYAAKAPRKPKEKGRERGVAPFGLPQPRAVSTLEERVNALKNTVVEEADLATHVFYEEEQLLSLYEDLLALPQEPAPDAAAAPAVRPPAEDPLPTVQQIAARLLPDVSEPSTSAAAALPLHHALIEQLEQVHADIEATEEALKNAAAAAEGEVAEAAPVVPVVLVSLKEWTALVALCVRQRDTDAAERVLALMQRAKCDIPEESLNSVLAIHARAGDVPRTNEFVSKFLSVSPTQRQRDLHIKAHLEAIPETAFPTDALRLLHDYEARALAPPQKTYSRLIKHLLSARSSVAHAHAWDLFAHMRYVAHPTPDAHMYTAMIRACASNAISRDGEPERALDLFTEMTVDNGIAPTAGAYIATILACARSGRKKYVHEGFRLAKEMMDAHRDAYGQSQFLPDQRFFAALLEGAKRIGDLARVRWILAEMVRESVQRDASGAEQIDPRRAVHEEAMVHVLHAYAAYRPPFHRALAPKVPADDAQAATQEQEPQEAPQPEADTDSKVVVPEPDAAFARLPPQSHAEVVQEAQGLYARLQADRAQRAGVFAHVATSPRLVNAYLSVHYAHAPLEVWRPLFQNAHADAGVPRNAYTYVEVLERCANVKKPERAAALQLAEEVFPEWAALEAGWRAAGPQEVASHARLIERAHAAMIRIRTLAKNLRGALDAVRAFVAAYPPEWVRAPAERPPFRSTRTNLLGARPLVRVFHAAEIPDDSVPPLLAFAELEVLHHRLVAAGAAPDVRYLTWVCKAYEGSLRRRREKALKATMHPVHKPAPPAL